MKVEIVSPNGDIAEERRIPISYPYQIRNLPPEAKNLKITLLDEQGNPRPETVKRYQICTRGDSQK